MLAQLLALLWVRGAIAPRGVAEGDKYVEVYINSVYVRPDLVTPMLLMNSARRFDAAGASAIPLYFKQPLFAGDVIAMKVDSDRPFEVPVKLPVGTYENYPGKAAVIAAFDNGVVTNNQWRCAADFTWAGPVTHDDENRWHRPGFDDSAWPAAVEQDKSCCPWRDDVDMWERFSSKWISVDSLPYWPNGTAMGSLQSKAGPRKFYCRYRVPEGSTLMDGSRLHASIAAPVVNVTSLRMSQSVTEVTFSLGRAADVTCMVLDARFELRPPTAVELKKSGVTEFKSPIQRVWRDVTGADGQRVFATAALEWHRVSDIYVCREKCEANTQCAFITFYDKGNESSIVAGANCKLMSKYDIGDLTASVRSDLLLIHNARLYEPSVTQLYFSQMMAPGTVYHSYCMANDTQTGQHSTWSAIAGTRLDARTDGCFDCGAQDPPKPRLLGGYSSYNTITAIVKTDAVGRVFCAVRDMSMYGPSGGGVPLTLAEVKEQKHYNLALVANAAVPVVIDGLHNSTPYEVVCVSETDGGTPSKEEDMEDARRLWFTEAHDVLIESLSLKEDILLSQYWGTEELAIVTEIRVKNQGYLWCQVYNASDMRDKGVPRYQTLENTAPRQKMLSARQDGGSMFDGLDPKLPYEVYCTGRYDDFKNETDALALTSPMAAVIQDLIIDYTHITMKVQIKAPARKSDTWCRAFRWNLRPYAVRPDLPSPEEMQEPIMVHIQLLELGGGDVTVRLAGMDPGSLYDLYCYVKEVVEGVPYGAIPPPVASMNEASFLATRTTVRTKGPEFRPDGWHCTAGRYCTIDNVRGDSLTRRDQLVVRQSWCRGPCACNGQEDTKRKGAQCSKVSQALDVRSPDPQHGGEVDEEDPRGAWCYVDPGACEDGEPSAIFPDLWISYGACTFSNPVTRTGAGPVGFPNEGLAQTADDGSTYDWGQAPLVAHGFAYNLCWCNGTESYCKEEGDFYIRVGVLYVAGPTIEQNLSTEVCVSNQPCTVWHFAGEAVENGNRLAVLPISPLGCNWQKPTPFDPPGVAGFPNYGVSEPAINNGYTYSWGTLPVNADGGTYLLCWCGALFPNGTSACPALRPHTGEMFLQPSGYIRLIAPEMGIRLNCKVGLKCILPNIPGTGLQGGDRLQVLKECGQEVPMPENWTMGLPLSDAPTMPDSWVEGGWLLYDSRAADNLNMGFGSPTSDVDLSSTDPRGLWGMPSKGISEPDARIGYYSWGAPSLAIPGWYTLCWCATGFPCTSPADFGVLMGTLLLEGPTVLPAASQAFVCVRKRGCRVNGMQGYLAEPAGKLFVAQDQCGGVAARGIPQDGESLNSADGSVFSWGAKPVEAPPGRYRLCWCADQCYSPSDYKTFAGVLRVKAPFGPRLYWACAQNGGDCIIDNIRGEALNSGDKVALMTKCGDGEITSDFGVQGISVETGPDGTWFRLPPVKGGGVYRVCWCAAEILCVHGREFSTTLGSLLVGGPDPSALYVCFEWYKCRIDGLLGSFLSDGDRLRVVPAGEDCSRSGNSSNSSLGIVQGFPDDGLSSLATNQGKSFAWSERIRAPPGVYDLCWCSATTVPKGICGTDGPFSLRAGSIRIGTPKEYNFLNRVQDPEPRSDDWMYALSLAILIPIVVVLVAVLGWRKYYAGSSNPDPEAPNPFHQDKTAVQKEHDKLKLEYSIKSVGALRHFALGTMPGQVLDSEGTGKHGVDMDEIDFTSQNEKVALRAIADRRTRADSRSNLPILDDALPGQLGDIQTSAELATVSKMPPQPAHSKLPEIPRGEPSHMSLNMIDPEDDAWKPDFPNIALPLRALDDPSFGPRLREILGIGTGGTNGKAG